MNVFDLVNTVLTETYAKIPGDDAAKDAAVLQALLHMQDRYKSLLHGPGPNYSHPATRFGYIFRYVTSNANVVQQVIAQCPELRALFDRQVLSVTCLGGGPGSDVLGLLKYMQLNSKSPPVLCHICDRDTGWSDSWGDVGLKMASAIWMQTAYLEHDATRPDTWSKTTRYLEADLFLCIYFLSEVYSCKAEADAYFQYVFSNAKPGAMFLYVDNRNSNFTGWWDAIAAANSVEPVYASDDTWKMPYHEQKDSLAAWMTKFANANPKLDANVDIRVGRKRHRQ